MIGYIEGEEIGDIVLNFFSGINFNFAQMTSPLTEDPWIFRIVHIGNIEFILRNGLFAYDHLQGDPHYIGIGDSDLTSNRLKFEIPIAEQETLGKYIPFYFGPRSPMLYRIFTGSGVDKRPQHDIIYICCKMKRVGEDQKIIFTDGHASNNLTRFYTDPADLNKLDWDTIVAKQWNNDSEDPDRQRKKQAECLVYQHVPPACIEAIVVYDETAAQSVKKVLLEKGLSIGIFVNPSKLNFYSCGFYY